MIETNIEKLRDGKIIIVHPDFSFKTRYGTWIYWEHLGMLNSEVYRTSTVNKIETYIENGILPSRNLFVTCDSLAGAVDMESVLNTIEMIEKLL